MDSSPWRLTLLVSDGRHSCSRSSVSDHNLSAGLQHLQRSLTPPPPATSQPVWIRLDALPPDQRTEFADDLQQAMHNELLVPMGIQRQPITWARPASGSLHLWVDLSRPPRQPASPLLEMRERALGWLLRHLEHRVQEPPPNTVDALAALLLLSGTSDRPDLELSRFRLTRALQLQGPTAEPVPSSVLTQALKLAVLTNQLNDPHTLPPDLEATCRALQEHLLAQFAVMSLSPAVRPAVLFSLAVAHRRGLTNTNWQDPLAQLIVRLQDRPGGANWERTWCLLTLVVLAETGAPLPLELQEHLVEPGDLQALAALPTAAMIHSAVSALRVVLMLRLADLLRLPLRDENVRDYSKAAERVLLGLQCNPMQAIEARDPQQVLGAFGGDLTGPAPLRRQLTPLLVLHQSLLMERSHALD